MKAIRIQIPDQKVDYWISDLVDLLDEIEAAKEGVEIILTTQTMTVAQFTQLIKENGSNVADKG